MWTLSAALLLAAQTAQPSPADVALVRTALREVIPLGASTGIELHVDPLGRQIVLKDQRPEHILAASRDYPSAVCPDVTASRDAVTLRCETSKIEARLLPRAQGMMLEIKQTLGPPQWPDSSAIGRIVYDPAEVSIGGPCPGDTDAAQGECAYGAGDVEKAVEHWKRALATEHREYAAVRLGDVAAEQHEWNQAGQMYTYAGRKGPWGRLALVRLCELRGSCFEKGRYAPGYDTLDPAALVPVLHDEMLLRGARIFAFNEDLKGAIDHILAEGNTTPEGHVCHRAPALCQRLTLAAFRRGDDDAKARALALYITLPARYDTPVSVPTAREAANMAAMLGAPGYGAALLSGVSDKVSAAELPDHLHRAAELYVEAKDFERARMVLKFAQTLPLKKEQRLAFGSIEGALQPAPQKAEPVPPEVQKAREILARLRQGRVKEPAP